MKNKYATLVNTYNGRTQFNKSSVYIHTKLYDASNVSIKHHTQQTINFLNNLKQQNVDIIPIAKRAKDAIKILKGHPNAMPLTEFSVGSSSFIDGLICKFLITPVAFAAVKTGSDVACEIAVNGVLAGIDTAMTLAGQEAEEPEVAEAEVSLEGPISAVCEAVGDSAGELSECWASNKLASALGISCDCDKISKSYENLVPF